MSTRAEAFRQGVVGYAQDVLIQGHGHFTILAELPHLSSVLASR